jgi:hypothetical protein
VSLAEDAVRVYPNPATTFLTVDGYNQGTITEVYDVNGRMIFTKTISSNQLDISSLSKGLYIIRLNPLQDNVVRKFVKK